jgi:hypothetical protein
MSEPGRSTKSGSSRTTAHQSGCARTSVAWPSGSGRVPCPKVEDAKARISSLARARGIFRTAMTGLAQFVHIIDCRILYQKRCARKWEHLWRIEDDRERRTQLEAYLVPLPAASVLCARLGWRNTPLNTRVAIFSRACGTKLPIAWCVNAKSRARLVAKCVLRRCPKLLVIG